MAIMFTWSNSVEDEGGYSWNRIFG